MTKKELIHQVLNTTNIDLYNFWAMKLLTEYPEYKQKILDCWDFTAIIDNIVIDKDKRLYNGFEDDELCFYYTYHDDLEYEGFLNYTLKKEKENNE